MKDTSYKLIRSFDEFELRKYSTATVLEIIENGDRKKVVLNGKRTFLTLMAQHKGISINESSRNGGIPEMMMEPLDGRKGWKLEYYLENQDVALNNSQTNVQMKNLPETYYGTIALNGLLTNEKIIQKILLLKSWLAKEKLMIIGKPKIAFYKYSWNIAFLKKVEIYMKVEPTFSKL